MPSINAYEIFSRYHMYFFTDSHFAQNLKMALLSLSLHLEAQYGTQLGTNLGLPKTKEIADLVYIEKKL